MGKKFSLGFLVLTLISAQPANAGFLEFFFGKRNKRPLASAPPSAVIVPAPVAAGDLLQATDSGYDKEKAKLILRLYEAGKGIKKEIVDTRRELILEPTGLGQAVVFDDSRAPFEEASEDRLVHVAFMTGVGMFAVVSGTKTGKSTLFNHLAGESISLTDPVGGATKHPVIGVNPDSDFFNAANILYEGKTIKRITDPKEATQAHREGENLIFWYPTSNIDRDKIFIDAPDIDSVLQQNWEIARAITRNCDFIIAPITVQKHRDQAMAKFFIKLASETGKQVIVIINRVEEYDFTFDTCNRVAGAFNECTGVNPYATFVVPSSKEAREAPEQRGSLQFYRLEDLKGSNPQPIDIRAFLSGLNIPRMKLESINGELEAAIEGQGGYRQFLEAARKMGERYELLDKAIKQGFKEGTDEYEANKDLVWSVDFPAVPGPYFEKVFREDWQNKHELFLNRLGRKVEEGLGSIWRLFKKKKSFEEEFESQQLKAVSDMVHSIIAMLKTAIKRHPGILSQRAVDSVLFADQTRVAKEILDRFSRDKEKRTSFEKMLAEQIPKWAEEHPMQVAKLHSIDTLKKTVLQLGSIGGLITLALATNGAYIVGHLLAGNLMTLGATGGGAVVTSKVAGVVGDGIDAVFWKGVLGDLYDQYVLNNINLVLGYLFNTKDAPFKILMDEISWGKGLVSTPQFLDANHCVAELSRAAKK